MSDKAALYSSRAAELEEKSAMAVLAGASEAEALDIASKGLMMPEIFLSASRQTKTPAGDAYRLVWATREWSCKQSPGARSRCVRWSRPHCEKNTSHTFV